MCLNTLFELFFAFNFLLLLFFTSPLFIYFFELLLRRGQDVLPAETEVLLAVMLSEPFLFKNISY